MWGECGPGAVGWMRTNFIQVVSGDCYCDVRSGLLGQKHLSGWLRLPLWLEMNLEITKLQKEIQCFNATPSDPA